MHACLQHMPVPRFQAGTPGMLWSAGQSARTSTRRYLDATRWPGVGLCPPVKVCSGCTPAAANWKLQARASSIRVFVRGLAQRLGQAQTRIRQFLALPPTAPGNE
eukprot:4350330-Amphidinium_carterae.1